MYLAATTHCLSRARNLFAPGCRDVFDISALHLLFRRLAIADLQFPANERTFLGYLRTSLALSMLGAIIAQLYRLQHSQHPNPVFGFYVLSKPLCGILQCCALGFVLLGCIRYFRQQSAMARGKVFAGGWEVLTIVLFSSSVSLPHSREDYVRYPLTRTK